MSKHKVGISSNPSGFPNPAMDGKDLGLDLNDLIVKHPASTFYMRVEGDQQAEMGIHTGDIVIIDKSLEIRSGDLVILTSGGDFLLRRYKKERNKDYIFADRGKKIELTDETDFSIWGVVTHIIKSTKPV